jgi:RHH-type proline utilization regulon transcriptional repressor/proline dehydrogenase/delta 1-pyrroline-5-carboxylate dehydrogenase
VNRNQIGAIVGSQPFGGEGLSGTGPKAGGPHYLPRLQRAPEAGPIAAEPAGPELDAEALRAAFAALDGRAWAERGDRLEALRAALGGSDDAALAAAAALPAEPIDLPGPTGESNRLSLHPRGRVLCLGTGAEAVRAQALVALALGNAVLAVADGAVAALAPLAAARLPVTALDGQVPPEVLAALPDLALVAANGPVDWLRALRVALSRRKGAIVPLETALAAERFVVERHLCIDTTAAGGNASLLAASA